MCLRTFVPYFRLVRYCVPGMLGVHTFGASHVLEEFVSSVCGFFGGKFHVNKRLHSVLQCLGAIFRRPWIEWLVPQCVSIVGGYLWGRFCVNKVAAQLCGVLPRCVYHRGRF